MKKIIKVLFILTTLVIVLPFSCILISRSVTFARKIDIQDGDSCWNLPPKAKHIYAKGSYSAFASKFSIAESDLVAYARSRNWKLAEITNEVNAMTHLYFDKTSQSDDYTTISEGLIYNKSHRGGFVVIYDRKTKTGYIQFAGY